MMSVSEALVVGEDWISEHYFTTDATKESFKARVLERRKAWDAESVATTRSRFLAERGDLEKRLVALQEPVANGRGDSRQTTEQLYADLIEVLGYRTGQYPLTYDGPLTRVGILGQEGWPLAIVAAKPVTTVDDLIAKHEPTLLVPWQPEESEPPIESVSTALSRLMVDKDGPEFALVLAGRWCLIAERERWPEGRWLAVDLQLVCERNDTTRAGEVDRALACLEAASLVPDASGTTWWKATLDASIKHAIGVSKDLQEGVRRSIEIIANEVVARRRDQGMHPLPADQAQPLAVQSLRYLYRILFLLYAEASPELGVLPVGAGEYDAGYGLDRLRDLVLRDVHTPQSRGGTHLHESLQQLFRLVDRGHPRTGGQEPTDDGLDDGLVFRPLRADLFKPAATALIDEVGLGNEALIRVLRHLLLTRQAKGGGKGKERGFVSYVALGINQLGAVYEGLMSYTGHFATEDMYEVARGGDPSKGSWLVPVNRTEEYLAEHLVREDDEVTGEPRPVRHAKGTFVYRLSGRDRQRSASYYTPEVLTRFTVQQALAELLDQEGQRTTAEEILQLTVCEPALGSGAFAIEAVRQLGEEYLRRREEETGEKIDAEQRPRELQRVKAHLALHQVYGVDLNSTAVELAEVSLWLDTMVAGLEAPWFGLRLRRGNSLVGARRATYGAHDLKTRAYLTTTPTDEPLSTLAERMDAGDKASVVGTRVHHFLVPAQGWGSSVDVPKSVQQLAAARVATLKEWRKEVRTALTKGQISTVQQHARRVERLWELTLQRLRIAEEQSGRAIDLWGRAAPSRIQSVTREQIEASLADPDGAYRRLRLIMDAWCALWFWPLTERSIEPPSLEQWFDALGMILGTTPANPRGPRKPGGTMELTEALSWTELADREAWENSFCGARSIAEVREKHPWLDVVSRVAEQQGFFHWELEFAPVFARGGFDLQVGNPPWVRPDVDVDALLADGDPWWALELKPSEHVRNARRPMTLALAGVRDLVLDGCVDNAVLGDVLGDPAMFPVLTGRPDLYRAFMSQVWNHMSGHGHAGLIHMETHFTDDKAGALRAESYRRLRRHWQFINELVLFDIHHLVHYGVNVYGHRGAVNFLHATALYHPDTVERSLVHSGIGAEPGFKDELGRWDIRAHRSRIQTVTADTLRLWSEVMESPDWVRTPMVYTVNSAAARTLSKLASSERISSLGLHFSAGWNEKTDREKGRFESGWGEATWRDAILQGPHLHVSTPLYKTPNKTMRHNQDWSATDFEQLAPDALPVTAYKPAGDPLTYDASYTHWTDESDERLPARDYYRVAWRRMAAPTGERTLIPALIPPGAAHVNAVISGGASEPREIVAAQSFASSILADFMIRSIPKNDIFTGRFERLPSAPADHPLSLLVYLRTLRLNCITQSYADLWRVSWNDAFLNDQAILARHDERPIGPTWTADTPLRRAVDRRNAQVEIDALVALMLGVPVDDLCTIYRTQFAVLYGYDHHEYTYDANGRLIPNEVLRVWRKKGDDITVDERTAEHPGGHVYTYGLPFGTLDREADFRTAYAEFERRLAEHENR